MQTVDERISDDLHKYAEVEVMTDNSLLLKKCAEQAYSVHSCFTIHPLFWRQR